MAEDPPTPVPQEPAEPQFLLGRLFVAPLIIVMVIIFCSAVVVLSFGAIASSKEKPIAQVLTLLESGTGEKTGSVMLLPRDKEMWQAAQELALRLQNLEQEVAPEELPEIRSRLVRLLQRELPAVHGRDGVGRQRTFFIMRAAAKAGAADATPLLLDALESPDAEIRREALAALSLMGEVPAVRAGVPRVTALLQDSDAVVQMLACVALSNLAAPQDSQVIEALSKAQLRSDDNLDVRWNTTLTLARLGSSKALPLLLDMLTREYWRLQQVRYRAADGSEVRRTLTPNRIDDYLISSIEAAARLEDPDAWKHIEVLCSDPSLRVSGKAKQMVTQRGQAELGSSLSDAGSR